jgi:hypothetical protein
MNDNQNHLLDALTREGVLINVSVRYWRGTKKLQAEDLGLDPDRVETSLISLGRKNLIPKEALQGFALIESRAHAIVDASTFPFLQGLGHFLPNARLEETMERLAELEREFDLEKEAFLARYAEVRYSALSEWRSAALRLGVDEYRLLRTIEESFPCEERMRSAFGFGTQLFQIRVPDGLADQQGVVAAREEAARQAAEQIQRGVEGFVTDCVASLREQTARLCEEMLESMRTGKTGVHQKTLNRLIRFIDEFKTLNFAGDHELEEELDRVRRELLTRTAGEYRDDAYYQSRLRQGLQDLAATAREMATRDSHDLVDRFGQLGRRRIQLGSESADSDADPSQEPGEESRAEPVREWAEAKA